MFSRIFLAILALAIWQCESQQLSSAQYGIGMSGGSDIFVELRMQKNSLKDLQRRVKLLEKMATHQGVRRLYDRYDSCESCISICKANSHEDIEIDEYHSVKYLPHRKSSACINCLSACNTKRKSVAPSNRAADHHRKVYYSSRIGTDGTSLPMLAKARLSPPISSEESSLVGSSRLLSQSSAAEGVHVGSSRLLQNPSLGEKLGAESSRLLDNPSLGEKFDVGSSRLLGDGAAGLDSSKLLSPSSIAETHSVSSSRLLPPASASELSSVSSTRYLPPRDWFGVAPSSRVLPPRDWFGVAPSSRDLPPRDWFGVAPSSRVLPPRDWFGVAPSSRVQPLSSADKGISGASNRISYYADASDGKMIADGIPKARKLSINKILMDERSHDGSRYIPQDLAAESIGSSGSKMRMVHGPLEDEHHSL